jgi:hypothetical protein
MLCPLQLGRAVPLPDIVAHVLIRVRTRLSPLEGDGFELPVPGRETVKPPWETGLLSGKTEADLLRNRRFESSSLQRGVSCEPEFSQDQNFS